LLAVFVVILLSILPGIVEWLKSRRSSN